VFFAVGFPALGALETPKPVAVLPELPASNVASRRCFTVWLHTTPDEHERRRRAAFDMCPDQDRACGRAALKALIKRRAPFYAESQLALETNGTPMETVAQIVHALSEWSPSPAIENPLEARGGRRTGACI
jgi:XRE family aerobic/anaerobic benzoate catabolism transcriptional regulator